MIFTGEAIGFQPGEVVDLVDDEEEGVAGIPEGN